MLTHQNVIKALLKNEILLKSLAEDLNTTFAELQKFLSGENTTIAYYIDGGARGNPGNAGCGVVEYVSGCKTGYYYYLGETTNNVAEYTALENAIKIAIQNNHNSIIVYSDSELVTKQINGLYKVKNDNLKEIYNRIIGLASQLNSFSIKHIRREQNKDADKLANTAMDLKKKGKTELTVALCK